jgi:hypothetical protein
LIENKSSDTGRVALKIVDNKFGDQQSEEMELIMSLKHQNIIQVFQVRSNHQPFHPSTR